MAHSVHLKQGINLLLLLITTLNSQLTIFKELKLKNFVAMNTI